MEAPKDLIEPRLSGNARHVLEERYLRKDEQGRVVETPLERYWAVAKAVAQAETYYHPADQSVANHWAHVFYDRMARGEFLPNSPTLANAGKGNGLQLSACYVLPVPDSIEGIFDAIKAGAIIHKSGGGTGYALSRLRPRGSRVASTGGESSGPIEFLKVFDAATEAVKQGGMRRGANMAVLDVSHPDILEFIRLKRDRRVVENFNISVGITEEFMRVLRANGRWYFTDPHTGERTGAFVSAKHLWDEIVESAWACGDPGLLVLDRANVGRANPVPSLGPILATNPCGEQFLYDWDACNLGSINVAAFVESDGSDFDWARLDAAIHIGVRFLDDVIDVNPYPLPEIRDRVLALRRIGLGIMGWAHALMKLGIPYDSPEAIRKANELGAMFQATADAASMDLADDRGAFPLFGESIYASEHRPLIRNACRTTVAPTGTISILAGCSSGIEPVFSLEYTHEANGRVLKFEDPVRRSLYDLGEGVPPVWWDDWVDRGVFKTAHEISPEWHVRHLAVFTQYVDNSVSKTINLPHGATREDVSEAYLLAYELGCLNVTVFRDGCLDKQVLNRVQDEDSGEAVENDADADAAEMLRNNPHEAAYVRKHPLPGRYEPEPEDPILADAVSGSLTGVESEDRRTGVTLTKATPVGNAHITLNTYRGAPWEVFITVGKAGSDVASLAEAIGRLVSVRLQHATDPWDSGQDAVRSVVNQLKGIGGGTPVGLGPGRVASLPDAVAQAMEEVWLDGEVHRGNPSRRLARDPSKPGSSEDCRAVSMGEEEEVSGVNSGVRRRDHDEGCGESTVGDARLRNRVGNLRGADGESSAIGDLCRSCGNQMIRQEGCRTCVACGQSDC